VLGFGASGSSGSSERAGSANRRRSERPNISALRQSPPIQMIIEQGPVKDFARPEAPFFFVNELPTDPVRPGRGAWTESRHMALDIERAGAHNTRFNPDEPER
jgi:hypothetical protein